jgi:hypothetical protein
MNNSCSVFVSAHSSPLLYAYYSVYANTVMPHLTTSVKTPHLTATMCLADAYLSRVFVCVIAAHA